MQQAALSGAWAHSFLAGGVHSERPQVEQCVVLLATQEPAPQGWVRHLALAVPTGWGFGQLGPYSSPSGLFYHALRGRRLVAASAAGSALAWHNL